MSAPLYDPDHALMLCRLADYAAGLVFLFEKQRMFREVLQVGLWGVDGWMGAGGWVWGLREGRREPVCRFLAVLLRASKQRVSSA